MGRISVDQLPPGTGNCSSTVSEYTVPAELDLLRSRVTGTVAVPSIIDGCIPHDIVVTVANAGEVDAYDVVVALDPGNYTLTGSPSFAGLTFVPVIGETNQYRLVGDLAVGASGTITVSGYDPRLHHATEFLCYHHV